MQGAVGLSVGLLLALGARPALAEAPVGAPPPAPPGATAEAPSTPASVPPATGTSRASPTLTVPAPAPPSAPATITVGMPQPTVRPINQSIGVGVALTYVSIPLIFISGGVLGVGYLVDSTGAKVTGWIMTGTSLALFGVGVGFLVAGSEQGPQPQKSASGVRPARFDVPARVKARDGSAGLTVPVISGAF